VNHQDYNMTFFKAIASGLCNGLMNSHSAGIGGGHFMTIYLKSRNRAYVINARERAPLNANYLMFQNRSSTNGNNFFKKFLAVIPTLESDQSTCPGKKGALIDQRPAHTGIIRSR
jgi:hypothetical protein